MADSYNTGGKHDGKGWGPYEERAGKPCDPSFKGAGMGTSYDNPNNKDYMPPGGKGSKGGSSSSSPSGGKY